MEMCRRFFILALILTLCFLPTACDSNSDDDDSTDGDSVADDDDNNDNDDDTNDDDATDDGDDASDDDAGDDDDDDVTEPTRLFLIGENTFDKMTSWMRTDTGWREFSIPPARTLSLNRFGPSFVLDGGVAFAAWNHWTDRAMPSMTWTETIGHTWLAFDPAGGWRYDDAREPAGEKSNVDILFATDPQTLWANAFYQYDYYSRGGNRYVLVDEIYRYSGSGAGLEKKYFYTYIDAMFFFDADTGLASVRKWDRQVSFYLEYDGTGWTKRSMPSGLEDGSFRWFRLVDAQNGFAIWMDFLSPFSKLVEIENGTWRELAAPAGCEPIRPTKVFAGGDYAVAFNASLPDYRFWELRDGTWTCRNLGDYQHDAIIRNALVFSDGRVFLGASLELDSSPLIFEVTASEVLPVAAPQKAKTMTALHAFGPDAPKYSMDKEEEKIP